MMNEPKGRPYVICHMQTSLDGRISGNFFFTPAADAALWQARWEYLQQ